MFGKLELCESTFSTINFLKSKYRLNISDKKLACVLTCAVSVQYIQDFKDLI